METEAYSLLRFEVSRHAPFAIRLSQLNGKARGNVYRAMIHGDPSLGNTLRSLLDSRDLRTRSWCGTFLDSL